MATAAAFLSFLSTVLLMFAFRPVAMAVGLVDVPGGRKRHGAPVPVIGGLAMSIGLGVATALVPHPESWVAILCGIYLLVLVGTIDDRFDLPANVRLLAQCCAALVVVFASGIVVADLGELFGQQVSLGFLSVPFTILFVMTVINAFNLIDGIDGLAGSLALMSLGLMALISVGTPLFPLITASACVVAGYLLFNLPLGFNAPVRAFMGDAGSTTLGLIVATSGIYLTQEPMARISPVIGLWFVAVPVFDLFSSIVRRLACGRSPFAADHEHLHHKLTDAGLPRRTALWAMLLLSFIFASVGMLGDILALPDTALLLLWFAAGTFYYQLLRYPDACVRFVAWLRKSDLSEQAAPAEQGYSPES